VDLLALTFIDSNQYLYVIFHPKCMCKIGGVTLNLKNLFCIIFVLLINALYAFESSFDNIVTMAFACNYFQALILFAYFLCSKPMQTTSTCTLACNYVIVPTRWLKSI